MFRAALFDYNGVLVDDEHLHLGAFQDTLRPLGIKLSEQAYWDRYLGFDDEGAFQAVLADAGRGAEASLVAQLIEQKKPHYLKRARTALVGFPGAAKFLEDVAAQGPVVVVSGALRAEIELGLEVLGVTACVRAIVAAEDTRAGKPDPEGYRLGLALLREHGVGIVNDVFVIEDSISGVEAATALSLPCIAVCHSYRSDQLLAAGAALTVPKIGEIDAATLGRLFELTRG